MFNETFNAHEFQGQHLGTSQWFTWYFIEQGDSVYDFKKWQKLFIMLPKRENLSNEITEHFSLWEILFS